MTNLPEMLRRASPRADILDCETMLQAADRIEALEAKNLNLKTAIATHGAEACGMLKAYHKESGERLARGLRAALAEEEKNDE